MFILTYPMAVLGVALSVAAQDSAKTVRPAPLPAWRIIAPRIRATGSADLPDPPFGSIVRIEARDALDNKRPPVLVELRARHDADTISFLVVWPDATKDVTHKPWVWDEARRGYVEGDEREDMLALAFALNGPFVADMLASPDATWDVWQWKAARTNPQGFAMDKTHRYWRIRPEGDATEHAGRDGRPIWIARAEDAGDSVERSRPAPEAKGDARVVRYEPGVPSGSAADVRAHGTFADGRWRLLLSRKLDTGHSDDVVLAPGRACAMAIAVFDHTGAMDRVSEAIELYLPLPDQHMSCETDAIGAVPARFRGARTGGGAEASWAVRANPRAPSGRNVVVQESADATDARYPLLLSESEYGPDVDVEARFEARAGAIDRAAGLVVRARDRDQYYITRANALEDNVRFYKVIGGQRVQIASADAVVTANEWHTLRLRAEGRRFVVWLDGKRLLSAEDDAIAGGGKIGLWTKADSVTAFDDLVVQPLEKR